MQIVVVETDPAMRATMLGRVREGVRLSGVRNLDVVESPLEMIATLTPAMVSGILIGPGFALTINDTLERVRALFANAPMGAVLEPQNFERDAVNLTKRFGVRTFSTTDLAPIATFLVDCEQYLARINSRKNKNIIGVAQLKGGVGTTTVAAALGACWAHAGLSVALVDFDDVNPHLTVWARAGTAKRGAVAEHLGLGQVPESRIPDLLAPLEGYDGRLSVIPQPAEYNEGFHFKANVIDTAPSASEFVHSLLSALKAHVDVIVIDLSRSWGIATFGALPRCERVVLVCDEDELSLKRTFDSLARLKRESDDPEEFDFTRWTVLVNAYSGETLTPKQVESYVHEREMLSTNTPIRYLPYSAEGRGWGAPGKSFYECADDDAAHAIEILANELVPFPAAKAELLKQSRQGLGAKILEFVGRKK